MALGGTGALIIGDVGQNTWEEIDYEPRNTGGRNYGWRNREGAHPNPAIDPEDSPPAYLPLIDPIQEHRHNDAGSITGGFAYRGDGLGASYRGRYFYGDWASGAIWSLSLALEPTTGEATVAGVTEHTLDLGGGGAIGNVSSFGVDHRGELYVVKLYSGTIFRVLLDAQPEPTATGVSPTSSPPAGGVRLTVTGSNFISGASVTIGGVPGIDPIVVSSTTLQVTAPPHGRGAVDIVVTNLDNQAATLSGALFYGSTSDDSDGDGMPDVWEVQLGLDPSSAAGLDGAAGDPDGDGVSNLAELHAGTHPRGFFTRYLAEGASSSFFETSVALLNPSAAVEARTLLRFLKADRASASVFQIVPPSTRKTIESRSIPAIDNSAFSTIVESDVLVVADRIMSWDATGYGAHAETSIASAGDRLVSGRRRDPFGPRSLLSDPESVAGPGGHDGHVSARHRCRTCRQGIYRWSFQPIQHLGECRERGASRARERERLRGAPSHPRRSLSSARCIAAQAARRSGRGTRARA